MRIVLVTSTICLAIAATVRAGLSRDDTVIIVADSGPSNGGFSAGIPIPFVADEDYDPGLLFIAEDLPRPPSSLTATLPARGYVRLHNKHDYG